MKIKVTDISENKVQKEGTISVEGLMQRLNPTEEVNTHSDILFTEEPKVTLTLFNALGTIEASGTVSFIYTQGCGRCLEQKPRTGNVEVNLFLKADKGTDEETNEDPSMVYYKGHNVDLSSVIEELIVLSLNPFWLPELDKEEKCSLCKLESVFTKVEEVQPEKKTMGELFKKAGIIVQ